MRMRGIDIPYVTLLMRGKHIRDVGTRRHRATVCSEEYLDTGLRCRSLRQQRVASNEVSLQR